MRTTLAVCCVAAASALQGRPALLHRPRAALSALRSPPVRLEADVDAEEAARKRAKQEKKLAAERLALQAEKAALEAERLELQVEQLRLATEQRRKETDASGATTPEPVAAAVAEPPPAPSAEAREVSTEAAPRPTSADASEPLAGGLFNLSTVNASSLEGPLQMALRLSGLDRQEELCVTAAQAELIKSSVFDLETFYVMKFDDSPVGTIFRGNLRGEADVVFAKVQERLAAQPALAGVQLLLLDDPLPFTLAQLEAGDEKRPVFLALGKGVELKQSVFDLVLAALSLFACSFTVLGYALSSYILVDEGRLFEQLQNGDPAPIMMAMPIAIGVGGLQLLHEAAHLAAAANAGVRIGVPVAIPSLQLGCFGCVTRLLSFAPSRAALLDVAAAGPLAAAVVSLGLYAAGLVLSFDLPPPAELPADVFYPVLPTALLQSSLLLGSLAQAILPGLSAAPTVQLHPLAVVGFTSALLNALQLLPVGRLDGGRIATAALGQSAAGILSGVGLLLLGFQSIISGDNPVLLYFGLVVIFFQRAPDLPAANDLTGVDTTRQVAAFSAFLFMLLTLLPCPIIVDSPPLPL